MYYWAYGATDEQKKVILGPFALSSTAQAEADKLHDSEVIALETKNMQRATRMIKAKLAKNMTSVTPALSKVGHSNGQGLTVGAEIFQGDPFKG